MAAIVAVATRGGHASALVRRRSSAGCVRRLVPGATQETSPFAGKRALRYTIPGPGPPLHAAAPDEQNDRETLRSGVETVGSGRHSPCTCGGGRTTLQA